MYLAEHGKKIVQLQPNEVFLNDKGLARWVYQDNLPEFSLIEWCKSTFGQRDKLFLDIGAHVGTYSWGLAPYFQHVHAFEPNREAYNCLCANSYLKGTTHRITTHCLGLSDQNSLQTYYLRSNDGGGNGFTYLGNDRDHASVARTLETRTLDSYGFDNIGFIKIDVEGHEKQVLQGALETLERNNYPTFIFESWASWRDTHDKVPASQLRAELFDYIQSLGYKIVTIHGYEEIFIAEKK